MSAATARPEPSSAGGLSEPPFAGAGSPRVRADAARERENSLGSYLQARRAQVTPEQAGLPGGGRRRVPGLRREEVARLAGISADYYLRLERGRDRSPSPQVLEALARVLRLDREHRAHLHALAAPGPRPPQQAQPLQADVAGTRALLHSLSQPAFLEDAGFDIVDSNAAARALSPRLVVGGNQLRDVFLDPEEQRLYPDWSAVTQCLVAGVRTVSTHALADPRLGELVGELMERSPRFRELWGRHEVRGQHSAPVRLVHPEVGELTLHRERLEVAGAEGLALVVLHAEPGSADADRLARLSAALAPSA